MLWGDGTDVSVPCKKTVGWVLLVEKSNRQCWRKILPVGRCFSMGDFSAALEMTEGALGRPSGSAPTGGDGFPP